MRARSNGIPIAVLAASSALAASARGEAPRYTVEFVGASLLVVDLNDQGWATGQKIDGSLVSWAWTPDGGYQLLEPRPGAADTQAADMSNDGLVVGSSGGMPVVWPHVDGVYQSPQLLPILPDHSGGKATAVNDVGDIVGISTLGGFQRTTLFTGAGGPVDLVPTGFWPVPTGINDARQVCGQDLVLDLDSGTVTDLGAPPGPPSFLWTVNYDINDAGQVCGFALIATSLPDDHLPARWTPGVGWELLLSLPTPYATATSLNERGDCGLGYVKAVFMEGEGVLAPGDLLAAGQSGWSFGGGFGIEYAVIVNDRRQLLTSASNAGLGVGGAVILTPTNLHGDIDGDGSVNGADLVAVILAWGSADAAADCNVDGVVNGVDLVAVILGWQE